MCNIYIIYMENNRRNLTDEDKQDIVNLCYEGIYNFKEIGNIVGRHSCTVGYVCAELGCSPKSKSELNRKYKLNENYFDEIDTEDKAYTLGMLYADGCNQPHRNAIQLGLQEGDIDILHKINECVGSDRTLSYVKPSQYLSKDGSKIYHRNGVYRLRITNKHMSERLVELGVVRNKTFVSKFPTEEQVPSHLLNHFIRGIFDGDGSVHYDTSIRFGFTGTLDICYNIQLLLKNRLGFEIAPMRNISKNSDNIKTFSHAGLIKAKAFRDWLYQDSVLYLERKKQRFDNIDAFYNKSKK